MGIRITFHGAAGEVTGSCHLLEAGGRRILVDCGMFQGGAAAEARNADGFDFDPRRLDAVVLTHAHIDHSGRLPLLVRAGYSGPIHAHPATIDLCRIMLADSAGIQESEAERENRYRARDGREPVAPLYTRADAEAVQQLFQPVRFGSDTRIAPGVRLRLGRAGHILGAGFAELSVEDEGRSARILFSGDLGHRGDPLLPGPETAGPADLVVLESTYGDRDHRGWDETWAEIGEIVAGASHRHGNVLIPAFAVGRSQGLLLAFQQHFADWGLKDWRIYLDSPMAISATGVYRRHLALVSQAAARPRQGWKPFDLPNLESLASADASRALNQRRSGAIIVAGSGMCTGGRILHHLRHNLPRQECHVMIVGYQAEGTTGRRLVDGAEEVMIWGRPVPVRARIHTVGGLSAHAGRQGLIDWYDSVPGRPRVALVHGEPGASAALARALRDEFGAQVEVPAVPGASVTL